MRFLADMNISLSTVSWLREQGHEVVHLHEEGLQRLPDNAIVEKARVESRIVLTMDLDFGYLLAISGDALPSVVILRLSNQVAANVNKRLQDILPECEAALTAGAIISIGDTAFRVRNLPIE